MKKRISSISAVITLATLFAMPVELVAKEMSGKDLTFDRKLGNCLACHMISGGSQPGNIGPPLIAMKARYPDVADLRAQIHDATVANPNTMMPPFGRHNILSADQIDKITAFIHTL
ncbi:MAG TPA: sulfur oxidation c-type cytochrome SoxX [Gammaproteobacteria bacterium]|jgi:sulfur-oxidizing protein SoxX|nr:sulfur oxidation c-type cytochrome SoxX [Gammaproteobacteria bacterium]HAY40742.1 sulfur oxidation c-type cytochrome SoxX [Gammaproteobacteria bacterium]|tara:strand:+ start:1740 stop:2087 length:348 start_codon:yes stop_codon:yes gene_type:complete